MNDPSVELELLYIDDLVAEMLSALLGEEHRCGYDGLDEIEGEDFARAILLIALRWAKSFLCLNRSRRAATTLWFRVLLPALSLHEALEHV